MDGRGQPFGRPRAALWTPDGLFEKADLLSDLLSDLPSELPSDLPSLGVVAGWGRFLSPPPPALHSSPSSSPACPCWAPPHTMMRRAGHRQEACRLQGGAQGPAAGDRRAPRRRRGVRCAVPHHRLRGELDALQGGLSREPWPSQPPLSLSASVEPLSL